MAISQPNVAKLWFLTRISKTYLSVNRFCRSRRFSAMDAIEIFRKSHPQIVACSAVTERAQQSEPEN